MRGKRGGNSKRRTEIKRDERQRKTEKKQAKRRWVSKGKIFGEKKGIRDE